MCRTVVAPPCKRSRLGSNRSDTTPNTATIVSTASPRPIATATSDTSPSPAIRAISITYCGAWLIMAADADASARSRRVRRRSSAKTSDSPNTRISAAARQACATRSCSSCSARKDVCPASCTRGASTRNSNHAMSAP